MRIRLVTFFSGVMFSVFANGADFFASPSGAGDKTGTSPENAAEASRINSIFNEGMAPGDRLVLADGTYPNVAVRIKKGGSEGAPKTLEGGGTEDGEGAVFLGKWKVDAPTKGPTAIVIEPGVTDVVLKNLNIDGYKTGISVPKTEAKDAKPTSRIVFSNVDMTHLRYGFYLEDITGLTVEDCDLERYTKHGFRFESGCHQVRVVRCVADCSGGDTEWEKKTELLPFGFNANNGGKPQSNFRFEDCVAKNNLMPLQKNRFKNGDGFVIENSVSDVEMIRCVAIRNQDGGYDLKVKNIVLKDCVALGNSRGFRVWNGGTLTNCFAGNGGMGLWANGEEVIAERCTFFQLKSALVTDDRSTGGITAKQCLIASCSQATKKTSKGGFKLEETIIGKDEIVFKKPDPEWAGESDAMDATSHPDRGFRFADLDKK